ncbi:MAG: hypothetical protein AB7E79_10245 [Rhodospirillaceae bacterium]
MPSLPEKRTAQESKLKRLKPSEVDPRPNTHGVLLSDEIAFYAHNHDLLTPFDSEKLKPAGYELTIGDEYFLSGEFCKLDSKDKEPAKVIIPPFEVAVLKTAEVLCLPHYMIARWNIRVRHAYAGLLWVGGPQVDPGYVGHLYCPIYNLSDKPVTLYAGDRIALIDFVKTTPFDVAKKGKDPLLKTYPFPPQRVVMEDYGIDELRSALFTKAGAKLVEFEEEMRNLSTRFITFTQISFGLFSLMIAVVALSSRFGQESVPWGSALSGAATLALSSCAFLVAIFAFLNERVGRAVIEKHGHILGVRRFLREARWFTASLSVLSFILVGFFVYQSARPFPATLVLEKTISKEDFEKERGALLTQIQQLSSRVGAIDQSATTKQDVEKIKLDLERQIQDLNKKISKR